MSSLWQRRQKDKSLGTLRRSEDDRTSECKTPSLSAALIGKSYVLLEQIGEGSSGRVHRGLRKLDQQQVALKCLEAKDEEVLQCRKQEYEVLRRLQHPHIVQALDFLSVGRMAIVVMSYHEGHTLDVAVKSSENGCFAESKSQKLFWQLMTAVEYMHSKRVLHRDIKAENLLISPDLETLHVTDFNTAKALMDGGSYTMTGTLEYAAPEVLDGESPSEQQDVWSCGLCLHVMLMGSLPRRLHAYRSVEAFRCAVVGPTGPVDWARWARLEISEPRKETLRRCLTVQKLSRPAAPSVLRWPWLLEVSPENGPRSRSVTYSYGGYEAQLNAPMPRQMRYSMA